MNDVNQSNTLEARVAKLERAARRWRLGFAALCLVAVGMGAKFAVQDAEFGVVRAKEYKVIGSDGSTYVSLSASKGEDGAEKGFLLLVSGQDKKTPFKATFVYPGEELKIIDKSE